jgi:hypothetical protein
MPGAIDSNLAEILLALCERLAAIVGLNEERVGLWLDDHPPVWSQAEQIVLVRPLGGKPDPNGEGGGRADARLTRRIRVNLWTRLAMDETGRDTKWLTETTLGHLRFEALIYDALWLFLVQDDELNWLSLYPMPLIGVGTPEKDKKEPQWGRTFFDFDVTYRPVLDQTYCTTG